MALNEMKTNHCGECCYLMEEDHDGRGWCALQDMYTFVDCGDRACEEFNPKKDDNNE